MQQRSEAFYRALLETGWDLISVVDPEGRRIYVSPTYGRLLGYRSEQLLGRHVLELVHPDDSAEARRELERSGGGHGAECMHTRRVRDAAGWWRTPEVRAKSLIDDLEVGGIVVTGQDVTDREELAHDFRNVLSVIKTTTGLAMRSCEDQALLDPTRPKRWC